MSNMSTKIEKKFWYSERIVFLASLGVFLISAILLVFTEMGNMKLTTYNTFFDHLFNSVSVGTLTGLARGDIGNYTFGGQFVLFVNMVISGVVTSFLAISILFFMRFGGKSRNLKQFLSDSGLDSRRTLIYILIDLAVLIMLGFGLFYVSGVTNTWEALFNSASHIFNDGVTVKTGNFVEYANNVPLILSGGLMITLGGIGISVRATILKLVADKLKFKKLSNFVPDNIIAPKNYTIAALVLTILLQIIGAALIYYFEIGNLQTLGSQVYQNKELASWYMSVSSRTAGFTLFSDLTLFSDKTNTVLMVLMFVGAGAGSFAGGVLKLVGLTFILDYLGKMFLSSKKQKKFLYNFSPKMKEEYNVKLYGLSFLVISSVLALFISESKSNGLEIIFEAISAISNTGLSLNITPTLSSLGMAIVILLMIVGKVGFLSFVISFSESMQDHLSQKEAYTDDVGVE